jgi:Lrp/AsnC family leucine-responsive transcriptional regulator
MIKSSSEQREQDERKLLSELIKNPKENIDTIAKHCGFSKQKVSRMIKQLEANGLIWGYTTIVDAEKQGLQKFILMFKQTSHVLEKKIADKVNLEEIKKDYLDLDITIETSHYIHGEYDWMIIFTAKDIRHANKFLNLLIERYSGLIDKTNIAQILYTPRDHCILNPNYLKVKDFI